MLIISNFKHSLEVEQALAVLEKMGIPQHHIMVVTLESKGSKPVEKLRQPSEQVTLSFEVGMACATAFSVLGISFGYRLIWGPLIWGLITAIAGFLLASAITLWIQFLTQKHFTFRKSKSPDLTIIIRCGEEQFQDAVQVLWQYRAMSIGQVMEISS
ncbi:hypothetical protein DVH26_20800 [Paenibacillus sp. H1-7]|uniref:hypothetical protein n=1 Tax=Paenibacillus sp. H1-7 TaxID=2282849 RepID=UPI001EF7E352|nr:hypothetical protein [Paenibacillus sp. H1-7]ULL16662.1 hypothetical protein DVH26_20800 [Paenibacillus sp. H1-7]